LLLRATGGHILETLQGNRIINGLLIRNNQWYASGRALWLRRVATTGGCPPAIATGTITVTPQNTITLSTSQTVCINSAMTNIILATTGPRDHVLWLPAELTGSWAANIAAGTPAASGGYYNRRLSSGYNYRNYHGNTTEYYCSRYKSNCLCQFCNYQYYTTYYRELQEPRSLVCLQVSDFVGCQYCTISGTPTANWYI